MNLILKKFQESMYMETEVGGRDILGISWKNVLLKAIGMGSQKDHVLERGVVLKSGKRLSFSFYRSKGYSAMSVFTEDNEFLLFFQSEATRLFKQNKAKLVDKYDMHIKIFPVTPLMGGTGVKVVMTYQQK